MNAGNSLPRPASALSPAAEGRGQLPLPMPGQVMEAPIWVDPCGSPPAPSTSAVDEEAEEAERTGEGGSQTAESAFATLPSRHALPMPLTQNKMASSVASGSC